MTALFYVLVCISTGLASGAKGSGWWSKWYPVAALAIANGAAIYFCLPSDLLVASLIGVTSSFVYLFLFRTGVQAKAQLDAQDGDGAIYKVLKAYVVPVTLSYVLAVSVAIVTHSYISVPLHIALLLFTVFQISIITDAVTYHSRIGRWLGWNHGGYWDNRRGVETCTGLFVSGPWIAVVCDSLNTLIGLV